jgi:hypothetical protein
MIRTKISRLHIVSVFDHLSASVANAIVLPDDGFFYAQN